MTRPSDIPQWAWDAAVKSCLGADKATREFIDNVSTYNVHFERIERIARALLSAYERGRGEAEETLAFVARWAWRTDPPGSSRALTDTERLSMIKYYPPVQGAAKEHIELAEREAAEAKR